MEAEGKRGGEDQGGRRPEEGRTDEAGAAHGVEGRGALDGAAGEFAVRDGGGGAAEAGDGAAQELELGGADEAVAEVLLVGFQLGVEDGLCVGLGGEQEVGELLVGEVAGDEGWSDGLGHRASWVALLWRARMLARAR